DGIPVAPTVTATTPANHATGVLRTTKVLATFSRPIDQATVTPSTFTLTKPDGTPVPAGVAYDGASQTATLTPTTQLDASTVYTAHLTTGIQAASDHTPLAGAESWSFTTVASAPTV